MGGEQEQQGDAWGRLALPLLWVVCFKQRCVMVLPYEWRHDQQGNDGYSSNNATGSHVCVGAGVWQHFCLGTFERGTNDWKCTFCAIAIEVGRCQALVSTSPCITMASTRGWLGKVTDMLGFRGRMVRPASTSKWQGLQS